MVSIKGKDKARVLKALYDCSKPCMDLECTDGLTAETARTLLRDRAYFNYLYGREVKVNLASNDCFDESAYDAVNGKGAAKRAVNNIA